MLADFYRSDEWRDLLDIIKAQRLNDNGYNICEHCGKPIVKAYDCIGHHVIYLTEENYIDTNISLNPDNIQLVHHKCHNKIHDRLGLSYTRQIYLVYGSPLSGKSTFVKDSMSEGDLIIDVDSIWECVSGCSRYTKPNRLKQNVFAVRDALLDMVKVRRGNWLNAYIIGGYPLISERERLIKSMGARPIFIDTSKEECIRRLHECNDGRNIVEWEKFIFDWWEKYSPQYH
jgi:hypothetical protein